MSGLPFTNRLLSLKFIDGPFYTNLNGIQSSIFQSKFMLLIINQKEFYWIS